ncbi:sensor domain-containing diguanylate cyclase [Pelomonas sp. SE-A7]|uniref:sensor domain-containing diguanylate cyclase n=1 Tax=Pelomonas sp. SE-A7 TaxID=3054953 RepID=UPI00259CC864|nr:sensor domain-containing diguanylate cyclase [Pelomonas sp. SE-A7]MDM4767759.1 sensor domain-containing diguanylate cyclase [Pelomonas sp. SE-A7]
MLSLPINRAFRLSLSQWMLVITLLTLLPFLAFAVYAGQRMMADRTAERDRQLLSVAQDRAAEVQMLLNKAQAMLRVLTVSRPAQQGDLAGLHELAVAARPLHSDAADICLIAPSGQVLFSTEQALGSELPAHPAQPGLIERLEKGETVVSALHLNPRNQQHELSLSVPLQLGNRGLHELRLVMRSQTLSAHLARTPINGALGTSLMDRDGTVLARSSDAPKFVGKRAADSVRGLLAQSSGSVADTTDLLGRELRMAQVMVAGAPWHVVAGVPRAQVQEAERGTLLQLALLGAVCIALSIACSLALGLYLGRQMRKVAAFHSTSPAELANESASFNVRELHVVASALVNAAENERAASDQAARAQLDGLTGLARRPLFIGTGQRLANEALRRHHALAALYIDLDGFKRLNDSQGHAAGDAALTRVAALIKDCIRGEDCAGRLGGDEFGVFLSAPTSALRHIAMAVSSRLVSRVGQLPDGLGCSIGIAVAEQPPFDIEQLLAEADAAMFKAKKAGKNRWSF